MDESTLLEQLERLRELCTYLGSVCRTVAENPDAEKAALRVCLRVVADQLEHPEVRARTTRHALQAECRISRPTALRGIHAMEGLLLTREEGDHARHGEDQWVVRSKGDQREANPARAGPNEETKEKPSPEGSAIGGRLEAVPEVPVDPRDAQAQQTRPKKQKRYRF